MIIFAARLMLKVNSPKRRKISQLIAQRNKISLENRLHGTPFPSEATIPHKDVVFPIMALPNEILVKIFSYIPCGPSWAAVRSVCSRWLEASLIAFDPVVDDNLPLREAAMNGHLQLVKILLQDSRVNPAARDNFAIRLASAKGHLPVVRLLLEDPRVDPSAVDNYSIRYASKNGHFGVVRRLLRDSRVNPAAKNNAALERAMRGFHHDVAQLLCTDERVKQARDGRIAEREAARIIGKDIEWI